MKGVVIIKFPLEATSKFGKFIINMLHYAGCTRTVIQIWNFNCCHLNKDTLARKILNAPFN